jgi:hypothetical protein
MEVDTFTVPSAQTVTGEGMAQVIGSRPDPTLVGLQPGQFEQNTESASCGLNRQPALVRANEEASPYVRWRVLHASGEVSIEFS